MKFSEMKDMTLVELAAKSRDFRHEMFNLRLQQASAQLENCASCARISRGSKRASRNCGTRRRRHKFLYG